MAGPDLLSTHRRQRRRRKPARGRGGVGAIRFVTPIMALGFVGALAAMHTPLAMPGSIAGDAVPAETNWIAGATAGDTHLANFGFCHSGGGTHCVVDGDTFWFAGDKYRIADIDTPETHPARCAAEEALGNAATARLREWLNEGAFSLESGGRDTDRYGRKLRVVTRSGTSVGDVLVGEGLARWWAAARRPWC